MVTQLLIYESAVPLSSTRHRDCSVLLDGSYPYARSLNSVPLLGVEFPLAALEYPIVFAGEGDTLCPAAVFGMRSHENTFIGDADGWKGRYVPAFLRRYPFVYASTPTADRYTLCIDEASPGLNREGRGERLFDDAGQPTPYVRRIMEFLETYAKQFRRTQVFCRMLAERKLLDPMQAKARLEGGREISLSGFHAINRDRLRKLPGDVLASLAKTDQLELMYLQLQSMRNFMSMRERMAEVDLAQSAAAHDSPESTERVGATETLQ